MCDKLINKIVSVLTQLARENNCRLDRFEAQTDFVDPDVTVTFRLTKNLIEDMKRDDGYKD